MKKIYLLLIGLCLIIQLKAQISKTVHITAGTLSSVFTSEENKTITSMTITGTIDFRDVQTLQYGFPLLTDLDLSGTTLEAVQMDGFTSRPNWWPGPTTSRNSANYTGLHKPSLTRIKLPSTLEVIGYCGFTGCTGLTEITIPETVTVIGEEAFQGCSSLTSVTLPPNGAGIGRWAFSGCNALTQLPSNMTDIGRSVFVNCTGFTNLSIPEGVNSIGYEAFRGCSGITTLTLPESMEFIDNAAFAYCNNITTIYSYNPVPPELRGTFDKSINSSCIVYVPFGSAALYATAEEWREFKHIVENLPGLGLAAPILSINGKQGGTATTTITTNMEWDAFSDDSWLTVSPSSGSSTQQLILTAEANPSAYGRYGTIVFAYDSQTKLKTLKVIQEGSPKTVDLTAGTLNSVLTEDELMGITRLTLSGEIDARDFEIMTSRMPLLAAVDLSKTTIKAWEGAIENAVPQGAFKNKSTLTDLQLPDSVNRIGNGSFANCTGLTTLRIPQAVTTIEENAFSKCINLDTIYLYNPVPTEGSIQNVNRNDCVLVVPYGAKELYMHAQGWQDFNNIVEMHGFSLSASVVAVKADQGSSVAVNVSSDVEWSAQTNQQWMNITPSSGVGTHRVTFMAEANPTEQGRSASVTFSAAGTPSQTITVFQQAQPRTIALTAGTLLTVLTQEELERITSLILTGEIDARDFRTMRDRMPMLTAIDISQASIKAYTGPEGTALGQYSYKYYAANEIPHYAFYNDSTLTGKKTLTSVDLPQTVIRIGNNAFNHCSGLTTIELPSSVLKIDGYAFANCYYLDSIYSFAVDPPALGDPEINYSNPFYNFNTTNCQLYVPYGSARLYKSLLIWQDFIHLNEMRGFSISTKTIVVENKENSTGTSGMEANVTWTASSDQNWLTVSPTTGTGIKDLTFTAEANASNLGRMATVTITSPGVESQTITVIQNGEPKTVNLTAGSLSSVLTKEELTGITSLILSGEMDESDFQTMRDNMPLLTSIDMRKAKIISYKWYDATPEGNGASYSLNNIPHFAFFSRSDYKGKSSLTSVLLPDSVKSIGQETFVNCTGLNALIIPSSVEEIFGKAFYNCNKVMAIYAYPVKPPYLDYPHVFGRIDKANCILYVPGGTKELYSQATQWKDFTHIIEMPGIVLSAKEIITEFVATTRSIDITTAGEWSAVSNQEWLTVSPNSGSSIGKVSLTAQENPDSEARTAIVTFSTVDGYSQSVTITQKPWFKSWLTANAGPDQTVEEGALVHLDGSASWNIEGAPLIYKWTAPDGITLSSESDAQPTFIAPGAERDTTFTFKLVVYLGTYNSTTDKVLITITHKTIELALSADTVVLESDESSAEMNITGNAEWTLLSDQQWLTANPVNGKGGQSVTVMAAANVKDTLRMATVTVSAPGADPKTIIVTQLGLATQVAEIHQNRPLLTCYPNPFTSEMAIEIQNPQQEKMTVDVYSMNGQRVKNLTLENRAEKITLTWDATDDKGKKMAPGLYLLKVNDEIRKVLLQ